MAVVSFPLWVNYEQKRDAANNSLMALLAAAGLAINTLHLTSGSTRLLPEVFPTVRHIERFNLTTDKARELLGEATLRIRELHHSVGRNRPHGGMMVHNLPPAPCFFKNKGVPGGNGNGFTVSTGETEGVQACGPCHMSIAI